MDRGFDFMIPRTPSKKKEKGDYDYSIKFTLFRKTFSLSIKVQSRDSK
jgi:hypothetical protein